MVRQVWEQVRPVCEAQQVKLMQMSVPEQPPHDRVPPQPSLHSPHWMDGQEFGTQAHLLGNCPAPQTLGGWQVPHDNVEEHPSEALPQLYPAEAHVTGTQGVSPHRLGPAPPQN